MLFHELGHFMTARWARVRVLEFGIGFPPRAKVLGPGKPEGGRRAAGRRREAAIAAATDASADAGARRDRRRSAGRHGPLHAELAADRRLREARGRGRRPRRRPARVLATRRLPIKLGILVAGVSMNRPARSRSSPGSPLAGDALRPASRSARPCSRHAGRDQPGSRRATRSSPSTAAVRLLGAFDAIAPRSTTCGRTPASP